MRLSARHSSMDRQTVSPAARPSAGRHCALRHRVSAAEPGGILHDLDVGPTATTGPGGGRPLTDNLLEFEDLVIFALDYGYASARQPGARPGTVDAAVFAVKGMSGEGVLATVAFKVQSAGVPKMAEAGAACLGLCAGAFAPTAPGRVRSRA